MIGLWNAVDFAFQKNDHTAAELILYPQGWQQYTPAADDPIFTALAGDDKNPAIVGFDPDLGAELYITNGDTLDTAYNRKGILAYTPEGSVPTDKTVSGFEFEDVEGQVDKEFRRHLAFSLDLAESADDPANPESHLGNTVEDFYLDPFAVSYGDPQVVQVLAKRELGPVTLNYEINGVTQAPESTDEWSDGQRYYQEAGVAYHRLRGAVTGTAHGDEVEVWFDRWRGKTSPSFTYTARQRHGQPRAAAGGGGLHRSDAGRRRRPAELPRRLPGRAGGQRRRRTTSTTSTRWAARHRTRSPCWGTTTRSSGSPATTT